MPSRDRQHARPADRAGPSGRRGGGRSLPPPLRSRIERLSGLDLSDVEVHRDSPRPATLNALAYTQGPAIHLAPGQERQLPHEAWHVVQQRQGRVAPTMRLGGTLVNDDPALEREADQMAQRAQAMPASALAAAPAQPVPGAGAAAQRREAGVAVVQRAVGFEFETGYKIERKQGNAWVKLQKMDVVKDYGNGIQLTADENSAGFSAIEMVLDPPVQEGDRKKFVKSLKIFTKVGNSFHQLKPGANVVTPVPTLLNQVPGAAKGPSGYRVTPNFSGFYGNPQLTGGFRYDRLFSMLEDATRPASDHDANDPHLEAKKAMTIHKDLASDTTALTGAQAEVAKINGSDELKAMVGLLAMYLGFAGGTGKPMLNYAKLIANSFMARTDFGRMFLKLPATEYDRFIHAPQTFVDLVLEAAGLTGTGATKVFERGVRTSDNRNDPGYTVDLTTDTTSGLDVTRQDWLIGITLGIDKLSSAQMAQHKPRLMGLGALGDRTDRVGNDPKPAKGVHDKGQGIILELRNMKGDRSPDDFADTALAIFDYISDLNA